MNGMTMETHPAPSLGVPPKRLLTMDPGVTRARTVEEVVSSVQTVMNEPPNVRPGTDHPVGSHSFTMPPPATKEPSNPTAKLVWVSGTTPESGDELDPVPDVKVDGPLSPQPGTTMAQNSWSPIPPPNPPPCGYVTVTVSPLVRR